MMGHGRSLGTIILAPVAAFLVVAGFGLFVLIFYAVEDFAMRSIRENLLSLAGAAYEQADDELDRCLLRGIDCEVDEGHRISAQLEVRARFKEFARQNEVAVAVFDNAEKRVRYTLGQIEGDDFAQPFDCTQDFHFVDKSGKQFYTTCKEFKPWNWTIILFKDAAAFSALVRDVRAIAIGTAFLVLLMAVGLTVYLRRTIGRPIGRIVAQFRDNEPPDYKGIREFEFLSDNIRLMMAEIAENRDRLEELVIKRTEQLEVARKNLADTLTQLDDALESINEGFAFYDEQDRLVRSNSRYRAIMYPPGAENLVVPGTPFETIVRNAADRGLIPNAIGRVEEWVAKRIADHRNPGDPHIHRRADGRWVQISERKTANGGTVAVYADITDVKLAEMEADQANAAKSEFLRHITHDIKNPMHRILGMTRHVLKNGKDLLPERQINNLKQILIDSDDLLLLIQDLLELARLENIDLDIADFDLVELIAECAGAVEIDLQSNNSTVRLINQVSGTIPMRSDRMRLKQIVNNLLSNARKFTEEGQITVTAGLSGDLVSISISDTGLGIPAEELEQLFDEFHQVRQHRAKQHEGTGLGLAICRKCADDLRGDISVESEVGKGSTFSITIPARHDRSLKSGIRAAE